MSAVNDYGHITRRVLSALHTRGLLKPAAFAQYVTDATGAPLSESQACQYVRGACHFPAELLPHLAAFVGEEHAALVWAPFLAGSGGGLVREDVGPVDVTVAAGRRG